MHGTSVPTVSAGYCGVETGDFDISLVNILQRLVHGGRAFLFTVNEIDLALSAAGGAEIVEQFVVVGVAGYAAYSAWLHAELKKNGVAAEAVVYQFEYSSDWADDFPTEDC